MYGCHTDANPSGATTVRDSAGVRIVENSSPLLDSAGSWRIDTAAMLSIGLTASSDTAYQFTVVAGAIRVADGHYVVAERSSRQLRIFGANGAHLTTIGRRGTGPGEFQSIQRLLKWGGDTVVVIDGDGRVTRLALRGGEPVIVRREVQPSEAHGMFSDKGLLVAAGGHPVPRGARHHMDSTSWFLLDRNGALQKQLATLPAGEMWSGPGVAGVVRFRPTPLAGALGSYFVFAFPQTFDIQLFDLEGRLRQRFRRQWSPRPVSDAEFEVWISSDARNPPSIATSIRQARDVAIAKTHPAFDTLVVDPEGYIWVREYEFGRQVLVDSLSIVNARASTWTVFDTTGRWISEVVVPAAKRLVEIGSDYVIIVLEDADGADMVRAHQLTRTAVPPTEQ